VGRHDHDLPEGVVVGSRRFDCHDEGRLRCALASRRRRFGGVMIRREGGFGRGESDFDFYFD
jgi:hypothetical protein